MPPYSKPRDQIQIVRVPTASTPFNALELHTRFRQNILCDFSDNVAVFRRLCQVMNLDILPQDKPLIAVLASDVSETTNGWWGRGGKGRGRGDLCHVASMLETPAYRPSP